MLPTTVLDGLRYMFRPSQYALLAGATYHKDGLATVHNSDFLRGGAFGDAYAQALEAGCWVGPWGKGDPQWRTYVACWAAKKGAKLEGDYVECGVFKGGFSRVAMECIGFGNMKNRLFYLLDTYSGIPEACFAQGEKYHDHRYADSLAEVQRRFAAFPNARIIQGMVPETLSQVKSDKICYLSIDMNVTAPEIAAAEYFWDRMVPGAVMVLDDYGWRGHEPQMHAFDEFARKRGVEVLPLPTGQGLIFKD